MSSVGIGSLFSLQLIMLLSGGGFMGTPPGERDAAYLNCAPLKSLVYYEWSPSIPAVAGAPGVDGFMADPEIKQFKKKIHTTMTLLMQKVTSQSPRAAQPALKNLPELANLMMGNSGCFYLNYEFPADFDADSNPFEAIVGVHGTLILNASKNADRVEEILASLIGLLPDVQEVPAKLDHVTIPLGEGRGPQINLTIHRHESYFILGWGKPTIQGAIDGLSGNAKGLGDSEKFQKIMSRLKIERTASVSWLDTHGAMETVTRILGVQGAMIQGVATMVGLSGVDSIASVTGVIDGQIRNRTLLVTDGKTEGLLSIASGRALLGTDLLHIPKDADFVLGVTLNVSQMIDSFRTLMGAIKPSNFSEFDKELAQLEQELGIQLKEDLLAAFGEAWTLYNSPSYGGILFTSPMATLQVKDIEKAKKVYSRLIDLLKADFDKRKANQFRDRYTDIKETEFLGQKIHYINFLDDEVPFAPSICLTGKQLYVALHPQTIKAQLRLIQKNSPSFVQFLSKEIPIPKGDVIALSYTNTVKIMNYVYAMAPYVAQIISANLQREGIDVTIDDLPSAQAVLPYLANSWSAVVKIEEGILFETQSPLPVAGASSLLFNIPMFMAGQSRKRVHFDDVSEQLHKKESPNEERNKPRNEKLIEAEEVEKALAE